MIDYSDKSAKAIHAESECEKSTFILSGFRKKVFELPQAGPTGNGKAAINLLPLRDGENICACLNVPKEAENKYIFLCTEKGVAKKTPMLDCAKIRVTGLRVITLDEGDSVISVQLTEGNQEMFFATRDGMGLRVNESTFRPMGRQARGVRGVKLRNGDKVVSFQEKPVGDNAWINGGFFVLEPSVIDLIDSDQCMWEDKPLKTLANQGELTAFKHYGFWQPMDTLRDHKILQEKWAKEEAPWKIW